MLAKRWRGTGQLTVVAFEPAEAHRFAGSRAVGHSRGTVCQASGCEGHVRHRGDGRPMQKTYPDAPFTARLLPQNLGF